MPVDEQHKTDNIHTTPQPTRPVRPLQHHNSTENEPGHPTARPDLTWALTSAQHGDQTAFKVLYDDLNPRILHYLHTLVRTDAEDIASETWLHIGRDLAGFHGSWHKWRSWAITIARNRALDHLRRQQRRRHTHIPIEELDERPSRHNTENEALARLSWQTTLHLITSLPHSEAQAVVLRSLIGLTATEAGHILGKEPGAIRTAAQRGLRKLTHHATQLDLKP
jgi:RNA polymerase sigma-70 factor (ECF subfamily)